MPTERDPLQFACVVGARIRSLVTEHRDIEGCDGIGVVVPGMVERASMTVLHAPMLGWRNVPLGEPLAAVTGLPVQIESSGRACVSTGIRPTSLAAACAMKCAASLLTNISPRTTISPLTPCPNKCRLFSHTP